MPDLISGVGRLGPQITHQHLLRSMDALRDHQGAVDDCVAQLLRPLIDEQLSDSGAKARRFPEVCEAHLANIVRVDLMSELFTYDIDPTAQRRDEVMDGKLLLVSNWPDLGAKQIVARYKSLADIERGFHVQKSEFEIAPLFHRLPDRIRAHASICFMALVLHRVMRQHLKLAGNALSPEAALRQLRRIQHHRVRIGDAEAIAGISTIYQDQADTLDALHIKKPSLDAQMPLL